MANLIAVLIGYSTVLLPQLYAALQQYQAQHPDPRLAILLSVLGAIVLHASKPPGK